MQTSSHLPIQRGCKHAMEYQKKDSVIHFQDLILCTDVHESPEVSVRSPVPYTYFTTPNSTFLIFSLPHDSILPYWLTGSRLVLQSNILYWILVIVTAEEPQPSSALYLSRDTTPQTWTVHVILFKDKRCPYFYLWEKNLDTMNIVLTLPVNSVSAWMCLSQCIFRNTSCCCRLS